MYNCEILADSINPQRDRLITMKITFPRIVLAEFNVHRNFSRSSSSSRAIPFKKMVQMVEENPFIPVAWQKDHKGMQGTEYFTEESMVSNCNKPIRISKKRSLDYSAANKFKPLLQAWHLAKKEAIEKATQLNNMGVTKQLCNRLLEPFMWHTVLVTANETAFNHFFELRCPQYKFAGDAFKSKKEVKEMYPCGYVSYPSGEIDYLPTTELEWLEINKSQADIHIQAIAELMYDSVKESKPKKLESGEWHIPYGDNIDDKLLEKTVKFEPLSSSIYQGTQEYNTEITSINCKNITANRLKIATARAGRISYETLGDNPKVDYEADIRLHDMLLESGHWSPAEHCSRAMSNLEYENYFIGLEKPSYQDGGECHIEYGHCRNFKGFIQYRHLIENKQ